MRYKLSATHDQPLPGRAATMIDLKAWRTGHRMTQQQAADALGISNSTVRAIEAGTREITATLSLACHGWDAGPNDVLALQQSVDDMAARIEGLELRLTKIYTNAASAFSELGQRVQMLEMRAGKPAPTMSESDTGMIARRAARSVLPE